MGRVRTNAGLFFLYGNGFTDGTATELKVLDIAGNSISLGEHCDRQTLQEIGVQLSDGSICTTLILYGKDGGIVCSWRGNERTSNDWFYNVESKGLNIPLVKGMILKINTAD